MAPCEAGEVRKRPHAIEEKTPHVVGQNEESAKRLPDGDGFPGELR